MELSEKKMKLILISLNLLLFGISTTFGNSTSPTNEGSLPELQKIELVSSEHSSNNTTTVMTNEIKNDVSEGQKSIETEPILNKNITTTTSTTPSTTPSIEKNAVEAEHNSSMSIFFVLCVIALGILLIHMMLQTHFQYLPESIVIVFLGALIGLILNLAKVNHFSNWESKEEVFSPTAFFLVLLPPIIFESGYNLHKGNFFQNIGSILVFAIIGTTISALVIGSGVYLLGIAEVAYRLNFVESFAFGSLISAVDPVATIAIFHALEIDPVLNMLVFGESILNDAISIVLTSTVMPSNPSEKVLLNSASKGEAVLIALNRFCLMFFASAGIGVVFALMSALLLKFVDLRKHPSLEFGLMLVFIYCPYVLAEGIHLSGIMAILFTGICMSHYTHYNVSAISQITIQQTMRTLSFICETCVFSYLGLAIFSFKHQVEYALVVWTIILCLVGRAANIFPLSWLVNHFREHKITNKMAFIMWFSGLRGAISYALSLHLDYSSDETRHVVITTTLIIVLFTTLCFGGSTLPLLKFLQAGKNKRSRRSSSGSVGTREGGGASGSGSRRNSIRSLRRREQFVSLSKTKEFGNAIDSEHLSELTEEEDVSFTKAQLGGFAKLDRKYFTPFFTRRFTNQELHDCKSQMVDLTNKWYQAIRVLPEQDTDEEDDADARSAKTTSTLSVHSTTSRTNII